MSAAPTINRYAATDSEAQARFDQWRHHDPLPGVDPALLNAADIADYVAATGLIHPFDETLLKPASYPLALGGKILRWDNKTRKRRVFELRPGQEFELQPNAIAVVTLEPLLQLPDYIALRFNLRIQNVYRGLLLGTGPLVDPGFVGRLSFPLHNLTTNAYYFQGGENVVWVEFTKLSRHAGFDSASQSMPTRSGSLVRYSAPPGRSDVEDYVQEALQGTGSRHVWSSISEALHDAQVAVRRSTLVNVAGGIALVVLAVSVLAVVATIFWAQWSLARQSDVKKNEAQLTDLRREVRSLQVKLETLTKAAANKQKR